MLVWTLVIVLTVIACGSLLYAGRIGAVNAAPADSAAADRAHHRSLLDEIDREEADGQLSAENAKAARAELARDVLRARRSEKGVQQARGFSLPVMALAVVAIAGLSIGTYALIGNPSLPDAPLAERPSPNALPPEVAAAVSKIEAQLLKTPDDVRGWQMLGPVYMRVGRYEDAINAYRRIRALVGETPDTDTDLAEALSFANNGVPTTEALSLLQKAAAADPSHVRSRFYLAGEAMRQNDFARATELWKQVIALSDGSESWRPAADQALAMAEARLSTAGNAEAQGQMIAGMAEGLATRLASDGGTIAEWTRLVRAYIVLDDRQKAQKAYDDAKVAYPDATARADLDAFAKQNGLE